MKKKENIKNLIIALVFGLLAFAVLVFVNGKISQNEIDMVWSVKEIPQGTTLTEKNIDNYVQVKPTNDSIKNGEIIVDKKELIGMTAVRNITTSELMQKSFFLKGDDIKSQFSNPVLVSFAASDYVGTANGVIRRGDHINIAKLEDKNSISSTSTSTTSTDATSNDTNNNEGAADATTQILTNNIENLVVEDAYVVDAFDASGVKIDPADKTSIATSFNIYIEKDNETSFYNAVNDRNIAVSKIEGQSNKTGE